MPGLRPAAFLRRTGVFAESEALDAGGIPFRQGMIGLGTPFLIALSLTIHERRKLLTETLSHFGSTPYHS